MPRPSLVRAALLAALLPVPALAGPHADFEAALRGAYGAYRQALFFTNAGDAAKSAQALTTFAADWASLTQAWTTTPPPQYVDDANFAPTLAAIGSVIGDASAEVAADNLGQAHETLEAIRDLVGGLHDRNGIIGFSDRMNAYHTEMEHVLGLDLDAPSPAEMQTLAGSAGILAYLAGQIADHPAPEAADPDYAGLLAAMVASADGLQQAVNAGDPEAVRAAVAKLKPAYSKFFLRFG